MVGVWLNDYTSVPSFLPGLADFVVLSSNRGSSKKLSWAKDHPDTLYFACDDDLEYPPDYVTRMKTEWERWDPQAIVTACGRTLRKDAKAWHDWTGEHRYVAAVPQARWINYLGGCAFAFHTSLQLPSIDPPNEEEAVLSAWAQREGVPIRLIARPYDWPKRIPLQPGAFTLYEAAQRERFATRSGVIQTVPRWNVYCLDEHPNGVTLGDGEGPHVHVEFTHHREVVRWPAL